MNFSPLTQATPIESTHEDLLGVKLLKEGAVGVLAVAGGQGTRLKFNGPKGLYPIGLNGESLFELLAKKVVKCSKVYGKALPLALMTSPQNDQETRDFFKKHQNFGLEETQLFFFTQEELPFLNDEKKPFLLNGEQILAPDGNGYALKYFANSKLLDSFKKLNVSIISFLLIDNALTNPFETKAIGFHKKQQAEVTLKAILKKTPLEKLGTIVLKNGKAEIIEYSELQNVDISSYPIGNIGEHLFSLSFIERIKDKTLPIHLAKKEVIPGVFANKQETFIFDTLPLSHKTEVLLYKRELSFSPLKNEIGDNSKETVQRDLLCLKKKNLLD